MIFKLFGWTLGVAMIVLGVARILFAMATVPGGGPVNPTIDSEYRESGVLLIALGFAYVWAVRQPAPPFALLRFLGITMALLGAARVISIVVAGWPHWIFVADTAAEFAIAVLTYWYSTTPDQQQD